MFLLKKTSFTKDSDQQNLLQLFSFCRCIFEFLSRSFFLTGVNLRKYSCPPTRVSGVLHGKHFASQVVFPKFHGLLKKIHVKKIKTDPRVIITEAY